MKLSRMSFKILWVLLLGLCITSAFAAPASLYQAEAPVASYSSTDWNKAITPALEQVLIRVSGNPQITQVDAIKRALAQSSNYVQSFNYIPGTAPGTLSLQVRFSPKAVNNLLQSASQAPQTETATTNTVSTPTSVSQPRPLTLVWLAVQNTAGQPQIITDANDAAISNLQQTANQAGIQLLWPAGDLEDVSSVSNNQVWQLDRQAVRQASQRYQVSQILLGRVQKQSGNWQGDWVLLNNQGDISWQTQGNDSSQALAGVVTRLVSAGSNDKIDAGGPAGEVSMTVVGINGLNDYTALVNYLRNLPSVADVSASQMGGDSLVLRVVLRNSQEELANEIAKDNKLTLEANANPPALTYRWIAANAAVLPNQGKEPTLGNSSFGLANDAGNNSNVQSFPVKDAISVLTPDSSSVIPEKISP